MNRDEVKTALEGVFRDLFGDPALALRDDMTAKDVKGWDSVNHINLIVGVEKRFGIKLTMREVASLNNVGKLIDVIGAKLAPR
ncbi:MAG: acyl carrier protein [Elusimicrobiota bacterium]